MNRIAKNSFWIIGCRVGQMALSFVVSLLSARYLGPANYGLIYYASSLVSFVTPIMQLGFTNIIVNELLFRPEEEGKTLGTAMLSCVCSSVTTWLGIILFSFLANPGEIQTTIVCALMGLSLTFSALEMCQYWFQAKLLSKYVSVVSLISYIIVSAYKIYLLSTDKNVYWFAVSYILDVMLIAIALLIIYKRLGGQRLSFSFELAKDMFSRSKYFIISGIMVSIFAQTDRIMIYAMIGASASGYYSAAYVCSSMVTFVFAAIMDSFRPVILENRIQDKNLFELNLKRLYSIIIYLSLIVCVVITVEAEPIVNITYGADYVPAINAVRILVWCTTCSYLGVIRNIWILAEKKQKYLWRIDISGAIVNVILNMLMIPVWGICGAAFASLITQFFTNVVMGFILKSIRANNMLMVQSINPKFFLRVVKSLKKFV